MLPVWDSNDEWLLFKTRARIALKVLQDVSGGNENHKAMTEKELDELKLSHEATKRRARVFLHLAEAYAFMEGRQGVADIRKDVRQFIDRIIETPAEKFQ